MNVRQSVLGEIAVRSGQRLVDVDVGALVRRLLLFDRVIVKSFRFREIPTLVRTFGKDGFSELVSRNLLRFSCEFVTVIVDINVDGVRRIPLNHFSFGIANAANRDRDLKKEFVALQGISGLKNADRVALEELVWESTVRPPDAYAKDLLAQVDNDVRTNSPQLRVAVLNRLKSGLGDSGLPIPDIDLSIDEVSERTFHIKNSLSSYGLKPENVHLLLQQAITAVANLDQRVSDMQAYSAITGFRNEEAPLLFGKLSGVVSAMNPKIAEEQFERVIELVDVPDFKAGQKVDTERLLKARESAECREFRGWLCSLDTATDSEIKGMVTSIKSHLASLANSPGGKIIRFATTTGIGLIPVVGPIAGAAAGAVDSFLIDRILPKSGVVAFLTESYPSLFISP